MQTIQSYLQALQNAAWLQTGRFPRTRAETASLPGPLYQLLSLPPLSPADDRRALSRRLAILLRWCQTLLTAF